MRSENLRVPRALAPALPWAPSPGPEVQASRPPAWLTRCTTRPPHIRARPQKLRRPSSPHRLDQHEPSSVRCALQLECTSDPGEAMEISEFPRGFPTP